MTHGVAQVRQELEQGIQKARADENHRRKSSDLKAHPAQGAVSPPTRPALSTSCWKRALLAAAGLETVLDRCVNA